MSITPRTDEAYFEADSVEYATEADVTIAMRDFARQLEVELLAARAELTRLRANAAVIRGELEEIRKALQESMSYQRELRADRDRLDWLDDQNEGGFYFSRDASGFFHATVCVHLAGKKIRAAIDSEMKLTKEENEN